MTDPQAAAPATGIPWGLIIPWVLGAIGTTATVLGAAFAAVWSAYKASQQNLVDSLKAQARSAESRAIAADKRASRYDQLAEVFKKTSRALRNVRRQDEIIEHGAPLSMAPPRQDANEPTGRYYIDSDEDTRWAEQRARSRSISEQAQKDVHLRLPHPSPALALEAFGNKGRLPPGAGREAYREHEREQARRGHDTPTQAFEPVFEPLSEPLPRRGRMKSNPDEE